MNICSFSKYILHAYRLLGIVLGPRGYKSEIDTVPAPELISSVEDRQGQRQGAMYNFKVIITVIYITDLDISLSFLQIKAQSLGRGMPF